MTRIAGVSSRKHPQKRTSKPNTRSRVPIVQATVSTATAERTSKIQASCGAITRKHPQKRKPNTISSVNKKAGGNDKAASILNEIEKEAIAVGFGYMDPVKFYIDFLPLLTVKLKLELLQEY